MILLEGEFKCLSLWETGLPVLGLPGLVVYQKDENGEPRLLEELTQALHKVAATDLYYLGDIDPM